MRLVTAVLWALAIAGVAYWGWLISGTSARAVAPQAAVVSGAADASSDAQTIARFLGAQEAMPPGPGPGPSERFLLRGVIAGANGEGAALIAVDGKPAKPFPVGVEIASGYVLKSVGQREASLAENPQGPVRAVLALSAQRGSPAVAPPAPAAMPPAPPAADRPAGLPVPAAPVASVPSSAASARSESSPPASASPRPLPAAPGPVTQGLPTSQQPALMRRGDQR